MKNGDARVNGIENEPKAVENYQQLMGLHDKDIEVQETGLLCSAPVPDTAPAAACGVAQQAAPDSPQDVRDVAAEDSCDLWSERKTRFLIAGYNEKKEGASWVERWLPVRFISCTQTLVLAFS